MSTDRYQSPLSERYASKEMQYIFSPDKKFSTWRRLWIALARAEMELGLPVTQEQVEDFIVDCVSQAGSNPCPPVVVGVGLGGDFESCALAAKEALCRPVGLHNEDDLYAELEEETLARLNELDVGPQGFGGRTTALWVSFEPRPTHIAGLPCAVNMGCHVTRHASGAL